jgi:hypothetical protein
VFRHDFGLVGPRRHRRHGIVGCASLIFLRVACCVLTRSPVQGGFARTRYQSLASPSPHLEAALTKIKVLPMIPNRTPAGCHSQKRLFLSVIVDGDRPRNACRLCCLQIHRLCPPKSASTGSTLPHSIHTGLKDWLVDNVTGYMLPAHANRGQ